MNLRSFFRIILLSFYSQDLYMSVVGKWKHWGLGFLLRFSILVTFIASLVLFTLIAMVDFNDDSVKEVLNNIPELRISNDNASFVNPEIKSPVNIKDANSNNNIIILDLDAKDADKYQNDNVIVFISDRIVLNLFQSSPAALAYKDLIDDDKINIVDGNFLLKFLNTQQKKLLEIILFVGVPLGSLIYFALTLLKVTFYASIASLFAMVFKLNLTFKQLTRTAIIANVPAVLVSSVFSIMFFRNAGSDIDQFIVSSVHLFYFIGAVLLYLKKTRIDTNFQN